jgi:hypothetical protein
MAEEVTHSSRARGLPNPNELRRAQKKYRTFDAAASTEYDRLKTQNSRRPLTASKNPAEHARYYHLCDMRSKCDIFYFVFCFRFVCRFNFFYYVGSSFVGERESKERGERSGETKSPGAHITLYSLVTNSICFVCF